MADPRHAADALLVLVEQDRRTRCEAIERESIRQSREALAAARSAARLRVGDVLRAERRRLRQRTGAAEAELATAKRRHETRHVAAMLALGLQRLAGALVARWRDPAGRDEWSAHVLEGARASFGDTPFEVEHSPTAGLKVRAGGNVIDGTLEGLLGDRDAVGAALLARLGKGSSE